MMRLKEISVEKRILLGLLRNRNNIPKKEDVLKVNWNAFLKITPESLLRVIYDKHAFANVMPREVRETIKEKIYVCIKRRLILKTLLKESYHVFKKNNLDFILLKGFALENRIYKESQRYFDDIDVLINEEDMGRARMLLEKIGYSENIGKYPPKYYSKYTQHMHFLRKIGKKNHINIDVHTRLAEPFAPVKINTCALFKDSKSLLINKNKMKVLCNEDILIHLCIQWVYTDVYDSAIKHAYEISELINNDDENRNKKSSINWDKLIKKCARGNCSAFVYQGIIFSKQLFEIKMPKSVLQKLKKQSRRDDLILLRLAQTKGLENLREEGKAMYRIKKWLLKIFLAKGIKNKMLVLSNMHYLTTK